MRDRPEGSRRVERFSVSWMEIIKDAFQMEGKECKDQRYWKKSDLGERDEHNGGVKNFFRIQNRTKFKSLPNVLKPTLEMIWGGGSHYWLDHFPKCGCASLKFSKHL